MAKIDIIIPLYNKERTVVRSVNSIIEQSFKDWHLIIVNDGSTDKSLEAVDAIDDSRIEIINQKNQGPGSARNTGLSAAKSVYTAFLDADDQWYPWYLENSLKAIEKSNASFVGTMYYEWPKQIDMTGYWNKRNVKEGVYKVTKKDTPEQVDSWIRFFHVGTTIVKTEIARKYGGFYDQNKCCTGEDTIFFAKLVFNERFAITGPPAVRHNRQDSGLSITHSHPITPVLTESEILLRYCPEDKIELCKDFLAIFALRTAHHKTRNGFKNEARYLLKKHPRTKKLGLNYYKCLLEILFSRWMPYWVALKVKTGPPIRLCIRKISYTCGLSKQPPEI